MVDPKLHDRYRTLKKCIIDPEYFHMVDPEKKCMVEPKKKMHVIDQEKTAWLIHEKITSSMQIQLGTICNPRLCHAFHLPSHFTRASKMVYMNSPTPHPHPRCVIITYHMPSALRI